MQTHYFYSERNEKKKTQFLQFDFKKRMGLEEEMHFKIRDS